MALCVREARAGGRLDIKMSSYRYKDPMLKIRRSRDRLIFNMGIPIPEKYGFYIETGPSWLHIGSSGRYVSFYNDLTGHYYV